MAPRWLELILHMCSVQRSKEGFTETEALVVACMFTPASYVYETW